MKGFQRLGKFDIATQIARQAYDYYCEVISVPDSDTCVLCGPRAGDLLFLDVCGKRNIILICKITTDYILFSEN